MAFDFGSGFSDIDLSTITGGSTYDPPLNDVSMGAPDMTTGTPTGNGFGVFLDTAMQDRIFGGLEKVLNYALVRDQVSMTRNAQHMQANAYAQPGAVQARQTQNTTLLIWGGIGLAVFLALKA
jgi:hypothetical protein